MIKARMKSYELYLLATGVDTYGLTNTSKSKLTDINAYIQPYSQSIINNPKYNEVKLIGVTDYGSLNLNEYVKVDNIFYLIIEVDNSPRYNKFLLRECN